MVNNPETKVNSAYLRIYGSQPEIVVRAPGRVNLIGEHTDYNDGFVLPMAIDRATWLALSPRQDPTIEVTAADFDQRIAFQLNQLDHTGPKWAEYVKGVLWALGESGYEPHGWQGVFAGNIPIGAGLSSSAALELAIACGTAAVSNIPWDPVEMAILSQKAENQWVGLNCGVMDQLISACGEEGQAVLIDCRSLETNPAPIPDNCAVFVLDTGTRRGLVDSAYNERRQQCEQVARHFGVPALRDLNYAQLVAGKDELTPVLFKRAHHIVSENQRTRDAHQALLANDPEILGRLMIESHVSLRDDYEVSSDALNTIVDTALELPGCYGARMTGAGFGGCAIALVQSIHAESFETTIHERYFKRTGQQPQIYRSRASQGAQVIKS